MSEKKIPVFVDLFAGCGGLSLGLMQAGYKGLFAVEKDVNAFATLSHNLLSPNSVHSFEWPSWLPKKPFCLSEIICNYKADILKLRKNLDLVVGGPPCQGFSSAGKRNPADPRNKLVLEYLQFIDLAKPKLVLIENVRGMKSDFKDVSESSGKRNYAEWIANHLNQDYCVHHEVIDVSQFGVPQKRMRLFIVGVRRDLEVAEINPLALLHESKDSFLNDKGLAGLPISSKSAISDLEVGKNGVRESQDSKGFQEIAYCGPSNRFQRVLHSGHRQLLTDTRLARHRQHIQNRFSEIIRYCHAEGRLNTNLPVDYKASLGLKKSAIRVLDPDLPAPTITSMPDDLLHYSEPRTLTVRENARLQSFPDWFEFKGKYTSGGLRRRTEVPRFTQVANAVPPFVAEAFGKALLRLLDQQKSSSIVSKAQPVSREIQAA